MDGQPLDFFLSGLQKLEQRAKKCTELRGEYVELIPSLVTVASGRAKDLSTPPRSSSSSSSSSSISSRSSGSNDDGSSISSIICRCSTRWFKYDRD